MNKVLRVVGYLWASPFTILGTIFVSAFSLVGWYTWYSYEHDALTWVVNSSKLPKFVRKTWQFKVGKTFGQVVVLKIPPNRDSWAARSFLHEIAHVHQYMKLGVLYPVVYGLNYLLIRVSLPNANGYYDNPMEIDARRFAGETIDVVGVINKIKTRLEHFKNVKVNQGIR